MPWEWLICFHFSWDPLCKLIVFLYFSSFSSVIPLNMFFCLLYSLGQHSWVYCVSACLVSSSTLFLLDSLYVIFSLAREVDSTDGALHLSIVRSTSGTNVSSDSNENLCFSGEPFSEALWVAFLPRHPSLLNPKWCPLQDLPPKFCGMNRFSEQGFISDRHS